MGKVKLLDERRNVPLAVKASQREKELMQRLADKYADGSLSRWIRYAALNFKPSDADLERRPVHTI